ncbi:MAG: ABC transporter permease subunit [Bacillota bacterium]
MNTWKKAVFPMRDIWTVFRKEVYRVFSDKRLILTIFILPGLSIYLIYTVMGSLLSDMDDEVENHEPIIYQTAMPESIEDRIVNQMDAEIHDASDMDEDTLEAKVMDGEYDLVLLFDENFMDAIEDYESANPPGLEVFYNQGEQKSSRAYSELNSVLSGYHQEVVQRRLSDPSDYQVYDLTSKNIVDESNVVAEGIAMIMPMLIIIFLFSGAMSIGPDAIAGEKERGTIATLLVRPVKRSSIAIGKVTSLSLLSLISALSSFVGIILSLPKLMQLDDSMPDVSIYTFQDYLALLVILITTVVFVVGLVSVISAFAKTIKEASMLIMPVYFLAMIVGIMNSFGADVHQGALVHLIPIYGQINILAGILTFDYSMFNLLLTVVSSLVYTLGFVVLLNVMFNSEKIMFNR